MKIEHSKQSGAALIVTLVALLILTVLGVTTMTDVMNQSSVVRNEQFRQKVFYAASSEFNVQIDAVSENLQSEDDPIIDSLLDSKPDGKDMDLAITLADDPKIMTDVEGVILSDVSIKGDRIIANGCSGESVGKVNMIAGKFEATASIDDGRDAGSIKSTQRQRFKYCWP